VALRIRAQLFTQPHSRSALVWYLSAYGHIRILFHRREGQERTMTLRRGGLHEWRRWMCELLRALARWGGWKCLNMLFQLGLRLRVVLL
jgi:hypothetical protein